MIYRYAHRFGRKFWIVRQGEIRIERIAWDGERYVDVIRTEDIAKVETHRDPTSEDMRFVVKVLLHSGRSLFSPAIGSEIQAQAMAAETARRLNVPAQGDRS